PTGYGCNNHSVAAWGQLFRINEQEGIEDVIKPHRGDIFVEMQARKPIKLQRSDIFFFNTRKL
ncbi:MAG: hypothetical protein ACO4CH_03925, partial [Saprospiraceae bacterium]